MTTATQKTRTVRLAQTGQALALVIRQIEDERVSVDAYFLTPIADGYLLTKHDGTKYTTRLGETPSCTCPGGRFHGHCKHAESLTALQERGKL